MDGIDFSSVKVYEGLTFAELLKEIHNNTTKKNAKILQLINELSDLVKDPNSATLLVPLLAQYLEVSVKNDDQLIKLAGVIQRYNKSSSGSSEKDSLLTEQEKAELIKNAKKIAKKNKLSYSN